MLTDVGVHLPIGQQKARTRWNTHESGAAFDRKKTTFLTNQAQEFIAQRSFCVIAGPGPQDELDGLLTMGVPGFVQTPDEQTCLLRLDNRLSNSLILQRLLQPQNNGKITQLGLFFICHATRERLCVQGTAELLLSKASYSQFALPLKSLWVLLHVHQAFFHCVKYIRTRVAGLTAPAAVSSQQSWQIQDLLNSNQKSLSKVMRAFISEQVLCFLCTNDRDGQCAVNHRGGAAGFLVTLPPDEVSPGGTVLLPDYAGNGAFEAIGNILESGRAALIIPNYPAQVAITVSGPADVLELEELPEELARLCIGAERVVALPVQRIGIQKGDWSSTLASERAHSDSGIVVDDSLDICPASFQVS